MVKGVNMRELGKEEIKALAEASGVKVPEEDLPTLTVRFNGMMELMVQLEALPLEGVEPIPTLLTQREGEK
jgi:Asp-tRNA(Asn)/Glu-tRNA(Gln) amidotransferase C subunit